MLTRVDYLTLITASITYRNHSFKRVKGLWETSCRATERHLPYVITLQCYLPRERFNPSQAGRYSIYLPRRDGRLSWPW